MSLEYKGVKVPDSLLEDTKKINIDKVKYKVEDYEKLLASEEYRYYARTHIIDGKEYITVMSHQDNGYTLVDGLKIFALYKDTLHKDFIYAAIMKQNLSINCDDLYQVLEYRYEKKNLRNDLDRIRKALTIFNEYGYEESFTDLDSMLKMSNSNVYRLLKILNNTDKKLLKECLNRDLSVRSVEAISTMSPSLQNALYNKFVSDESFCPTEKVIKLIKEEGTIFDTPQEPVVPNRTLGRAKKDRQIIEQAIEYDKQRGVAIKDIDNISSKIAVSNLLSKQEDAVKALENRLFRMDYQLNSIDVSRIENVAHRLLSLADLLKEKFDNEK